MLDVISFRSDRYKIAKRDNDSVYFEKVPSMTSLSAIQGKTIKEES